MNSDRRKLKDTSITELKKRQDFIIYQMPGTTPEKLRALVDEYNDIDTTIENIKLLRKWDKHVKKIMATTTPKNNRKKAA